MCDESSERPVRSVLLCDVAATLLSGPEFDWQKLDHVQLIEDLRNTYVCGQLVLTAQAFALLRRASSDYSWSMKTEEVARVTAGSASFRSGLLNL